MPPGTYTVQLQGVGPELSVPLQVEWDPAFPVSDEESRARVRFLTDAWQLQQRIHDASTALAGVRTQLTALQEQLKTAPAAATVVESASRVAGSVEQLQRRIGGGGGGGEEEGGFGGGSMRGQVNTLINEIEGGGVQQGTLSGPTAVQRARLAAAQADVDKLQSEADRVLGADLNRLNEEIDRLKIPRVIVPRPSSTRATSS